MNKKKVVVVDYGLGNLFSVVKACQHVGMDVIISHEINEIMSSDALILPGVGAYSDAMESLNKLDLVNPIIDFALSNKFMMGICLGMQLMLSESEEFEKTKGLGLFDGVCKKFPSLNPIKNTSNKVPQINWNTINTPQGGVLFKKNTPLEDISNGEFMYFVHSFYAADVQENEILSTTNYGGLEYCSSISKGNIFAFQFHPEKSCQEGLKIYQKFNDLINK